MLFQTLKQAFWDSYDHLGRLLAMNLLLFMTLVPAFTYGSAFVFVFIEPFGPVGRVAIVSLVLWLTLVVMGTIWFGSLLHFAWMSTQELDPPFREFFKGILRRGPRVALFFAVWGGIEVILLLNLWFYYLSGFLPEGLTLIGYILGGVAFWIALFLFGVAAHALPALVRENLSLRQSMKLGLFLSLKYPGATLKTLVFFISIWIIGVALKFVGIVILGFFFPLMVLNSLHDVLVATEEKAERARQEASNPKPQASSWKEIEEEQEVSEEERLNKARYERTFRDILRPWEM